MIILKRIIRILRVNKTVLQITFTIRKTTVVFRALVTLIWFLILPTFLLQLKSSSDTFYIVTKTQYSLIFLLTPLLCLHCVNYLHPITEQNRCLRKRRGIVTAVAMESVLKLVFFDHWDLCNLCLMASDDIYN
jgi:hypothetical protein